ncbi:MAG TPA: DUF882 domain-containing protein [Geobacteraceae bacterium]
MLENRWNRRTFLKATLAGALVLLGSTPAFPKIAETESASEGRLTLFNTHNREKLTVTFRTPHGEYDPEALAAINRILRCHYTEEVAEMDTRVIEYLNRVDNELGGGNEIHIISGYRSPAYNNLLRREGRHVAGHSLHMKGKAIDIAIPHVGTNSLRRIALNLHAGGVGYYPGAGFVHIDSGAFRTW